MVHDLVLADRLGFQKPHNIRNLIQRHLDELRSFGTLLHREEKSSGGRPGAAYYLNRQQAMLLTVLAKTSIAAQVRRQMIEVFDAATRQGMPALDAVSASVAPPSDAAMLVSVASAMERVIATLAHLTDRIAENRPALVAPDMPQPAAPAEHRSAAARETGGAASSGGGVQMLYGCRAIADYLGLTTRQTYNLAAQGRLPTRRCGKRIWVSRAVLDAWIAGEPAHPAAPKAEEPRAAPLAEADDHAVSAFLAAHVAAQRGAKTAARRLYNAYRDFAAGQGVEIATETRFGLLAKKRLGPSEAAYLNGRNCNAYSGVRLLPVAVRA